MSVVMHSEQEVESPRSAIWTRIAAHPYQIGLLAAISVWLYGPIIARLASQWWNDPNFSHGFFVPFFSAYLIWQERSRLVLIPPQPSWWGLCYVGFAMLLMIVGVLGSEIFLPRFSILAFSAGIIILFLGWQFFRVVLFPWAFLALMIPIPAILFEQITLPLQFLASKFAAAFLPLFQVPVLRSGNIIQLPNIALEVAQACSGIRSLLSLVTLTIIYGSLTERRTLVRLLLALSAIPIAVLVNCLRIVGTGVLAQYLNPELAEGFFHTFSGLALFLGSLPLVALVHQSLRFVWDWKSVKP